MLSYGLLAVKESVYALRFNVLVEHLGTLSLV